MQLAEIIQSEMSRANVDFVKGLLLKEPALFEEVLELVLLNEEPLSRRAIWVLDDTSQDRPELMEGHLHRLFQALPEFEHDGLKRHSLRILSRYPIAEDMTLELMDRCFNYLLSRSESIAVKLYAIHILYAISEKETGIKPELAACLEFQVSEGSRGLKNIGSKVLSRLYREMK